MNNGGKAEKENTPNEANLQEEEVLRELGAAGGTTWGARRAGFLQSAAGRPAPGRRSRGFGNCPCPEAQPQIVAPRGALFGEQVFVGSKNCVTLRTFRRL